MDCDKDDPSFQIMSDDKILHKVQKAESEDELLVHDKKENNKPLHNETFHCFDNGMKRPKH